MRQRLPFVMALVIAASSWMLACQQPNNANANNQTTTTSVQTVWLGLVGDTSDVQGATQSGTVLMGGSTDVDEAMRWMLSRAGGGDVVIIRASGGNGYNDYLFTLGAKVNSVETYLVNSRDLANNPDIERRVRNAEMVFIAGGDQANYVNYWRNTRLHDALNYLANVKKIPIGGTSAGCAILGRLYYSALQGTIRSEEALTNPFDARITIGRNDFLTMPFLANTITDTHYDNPDRLGRHLTFMARIVKDTVLGAPVQGIGVEERTAVVINAEGKATVFGRGRAFFLWQNGIQTMPEVIQSGMPLTWNKGGQAVRSYIIPGSSQGNGTFDLTNWSAAPSGGAWGFVSAVGGVLKGQ